MDKRGQEDKTERDSDTREERLNRRSGVTGAEWTVRGQSDEEAG